MLNDAASWPKRFALSDINFLIIHLHKFARRHLLNDDYLLKSDRPLTDCRNYFVFLFHGKLHAVNYGKSFFTLFSEGVKR